MPDKTMIATYQFPFTFDVNLLKKDLASLKENDWIPHYNKRDYEGEWDIIALRSVGGNKYRIFPDYEPVNPVNDTEHLAKCPYIQQVLDSLQCQKNTVRLMRLKPGAIIKEHTDYNLSLDDIEMRLHIPIVTNPKMEFYLDKKRVILNEGECWYLNFNMRHSLKNGGDTARVHLVIDCMVNDWLRGIFTQESQSLPFTT